jgi:hypothetical protein
MTPQFKPGMFVYVKNLGFRVLEEGYMNEGDVAAGNDDYTDSGHLLLSPYEHTLDRHLFTQEEMKYRIVGGRE